MTTFRIGNRYSRRQIASVLGGGLRTYLPTKKGRVVCGCFKPTPRYNPGAPDEVTSGSDPTQLARLLAKQRDPIPVFLFRANRAWQYVGLYKYRGYSTDREFLKQKMHENPARGIIKGVVYFEPASNRHPDDTLAKDMREIARRKIDATTKNALMEARIGQGTFRLRVLRLWGNRCAVTGSATMKAIRASHIKAWRESTDEERLDPQNGLPLIASLDALFDAGLISFRASGEMVISSELSTAERRIFGIGRDSLTKLPAARTEEYLAHHRENCFKK